MRGDRARIGRDRPSRGPQAVSEGVSWQWLAGVWRGLPCGLKTRAENDEKKGTVGAVRRRARMEHPRWGVRRGLTALPGWPSRGQKRVRMPDVSSSWFCAPNVDATV
ncbi:hypothetical protein BUAM107266_22540 [Burkholderia ambifaria]